MVISGAFSTLKSKGGIDSLTDVFNGDEKK